MPPNFYESLDKAFESAAFKNLTDIRKKSQEKVRKLTETGELGRWGMSKEEAEVLFSYSFEAANKKETPCYIMNKTLAERDVNTLRNHRGYILHLLKALRKLKPVSTAGTILYRGIDGKFLNFDDEHYKMGNTLTWPAFTSATWKEKSAYVFADRTEEPVVFEIHGNFVGYSIKAFSNFPDEEEILLEPETTFKVISIQQDSRNPKAKRIVVEIQPTPLMIKEAVENFTRAELNYYQQLQQQQQQQQYMQFQQFQQQQPQQMFVQLPPNWIQMVDPNTGRTYYMNRVTRAMQWTFPTN